MLDICNYYFTLERNLYNKDENYKNYVQYKLNLFKFITIYNWTRNVKGFNQKGHHNLKLFFPYQPTHWHIPHKKYRA